MEIQSRKVQLYGAVLHIHAQFTGLRFLMFHWPILSAFVGISSNLFFFTIILGLSWSHFGFLDNIIWMEDSENNSEDDDESEKKLKHVDSFGKYFLSLNSFYIHNNNINETINIFLFYKSQFQILKILYIYLHFFQIVNLSVKLFKFL